MERRLLSFLVLIILLCNCLVLIPAVSGAADSAELTITGSHYVAKGKSIRLTASEAVTWKSSDKKVAKVNSKGVVKGITTGKATIIATTSGGKESSWKITVLSKAVSSIRITTPSKKLDLNGLETITLKAKVSPSGASTKIKWSSSNKKVAVVSSSGKVTALRKGNVTITAEATDGSKTKKKIKLTIADTPVFTITTPPEKQTVKWFKTKLKTKNYQPYLEMSIPSEARIPFYDEDEGIYVWRFAFSAQETHGKDVKIMKYTIRWFNEDGVAIPDWIVTDKADLEALLGASEIPANGQTGGGIGIQYELDGVKRLTGVGVALTVKDAYGNIYEFRTYSPLNERED